MGKKEFRIPSRDGVHKLHVVLWEPEGDIRGVVQISHGMTEMIERYEDFALFLNKNGYVVIGNDHLGHGLTAGNASDLGYFCPEKMGATVVTDLHRTTRIAKKKYPHKPYILFGHSMGSFIARRYIMTYGMELDGAIICGTGTKSRLVLWSGKWTAAIIKLVCGDRFRSKLLEKGAFSSYQKKILNPRTENDWLTRDESVVDFYRNNPYCNFNFTVNGYRTLFDILSFIQDKHHIRQIPDSLPLLFVAGEADPVGNYGKGVKKVYQSYQAAGLKDLSIKLYPEDRHEILNELDKDTVYQDILAWILEKTKV